MRIVFMGTPQFAVPTLLALHRVGHSIAVVYTQPDRPAGRGRTLSASKVKQAALGLGLAVEQPPTLRGCEDVETLRSYEAEVFVVVAYGLMLPKDVLGIPKHGAINLHPSLLPRYRGAAPINRAIINGDTVTGVSTMFLNQRMDAGDVILQRESAIADGETAGELEERLSVLGAGLVSETIAIIGSGQAAASPQDETRATYAKKLLPEDARIDWGRTSSAITNLVRGTTPKPGAHALFRGQRLEISKTSIIEKYKIQNSKFKPGYIKDIDKNLGPIVATQDGCLALLQVKPQGKKSITGAEFIRGYRPETGESLA